MIDTNPEVYNAISIMKTYEEQKEDLLKVLFHEKPLFSNQIRECWKNVLDIIVEPVGWTAMWKVSRDICSKLRLTYPVTVVVEVEKVDYDNFLADVIIVEDNTGIPESVLDVPLIQLFPTVEQNYGIIDISKTASILHDLRVFFTHLWYPWDEKLNGNEDWLSLHFEDRLRLHYDILFGQIDPEIRIIIENLIKKGKDVHKRIRELEEQLPVVEIDPNEGRFTVQGNIATTDLRFLSLNELQMELNHISEKLSFYEKKTIRILIEKKQEANPFHGKDVTLLAWCHGTPSDFDLFVSKVTNILTSVDNTSFECSDSLDKLLSEWKIQSRNWKLFLGEGNYCLNSRTLLKVNEGIIQGLDTCENTVICDSEEGLSLLDLNCNELKISNVLIKTSKVKYTLLVRYGKCYLTNIKINCNKKTNIGVYVVSDAQLIAENCHFYNCSSAIYASGGSTVTLTNCTFENNVNGVEFEECNLSVDSCQFINNKGKELLMKSSDTSFIDMKKENCSLENFQGVKIINATFSGNKTDVAQEL